MQELGVEDVLVQECGGGRDAGGGRREGGAGLQPGCPIQGDCAGGAGFDRGVVGRSFTCDQKYNKSRHSPSTSLELG